MLITTSSLRFRLFQWAGVTLPLLLLLLTSGCARFPLGGDRRVLVMNFENSIQETKARDYNRILAEWMTANLDHYSRNFRLTVIERQKLGGLLDGAEVNPGRWRHIGRKADADYLVVGSIGRLDRNFILTSRLYSVRDGEVIKGSSVTRYCKREEDIYPVIQAMARIQAYYVKYLADAYDAEVWGAPAPAATAAK